MKKYTIFIVNILLLNSISSYSQQYRFSEEFCKFYSIDSNSIKFNLNYQSCKDIIVNQYNALDISSGLANIYVEFNKLNNIENLILTINEGLSVSKYFGLNYDYVFWLKNLADVKAKENKLIEAKVLIDSAIILYSSYNLEPIDSFGLKENLTSNLKLIYNRLGLSTEMNDSTLLILKNEENIISIHDLIVLGKFIEASEKINKWIIKNQNENDILIAYKYELNCLQGLSTNLEIAYLENFFNDTLEHLNDVQIFNFSDSVQLNKKLEFNSKQFKYSIVFIVLLYHNSRFYNGSKIVFLEYLLNKWHKLNKLSDVDYKSNLNVLYDNTNRVNNDYLKRESKLDNFEFDSANYYNIKISRNLKFKIDDVSSVYSLARVYSADSYIAYRNYNYSKSAELKLREINLKLMYNLACIENYIELANIYLKFGDLDNAKIVFDTILNHSRSFVGDSTFKYQYASAKLKFYLLSSQLDSVISTFKRSEILILNCSDLSLDIQNQLYAIIAYCKLNQKSLALQLFNSLENYRINLGDECINNGTKGFINILGYYLKGCNVANARFSYCYKDIESSLNDIAVIYSIECLWLYNLLNGNRQIFTDTFVTTIAKDISLLLKADMLSSYYNESLEKFINIYLSNNSSISITDNKLVFEYLISKDSRTKEQKRFVNLTKNLLSRKDTLHDYTYLNKDILNLNSLVWNDLDKFISYNLYDDEVVMVITKVLNEYFAIVLNNQLEKMDIIKIGILNESEIRKNYLDYLSNNNVDIGYLLYNALLSKVANKLINKKVFLIPLGIYREINVNSLPFKDGENFVIDHFGYITYLNSIYSLSVNPILDINKGVFAFVNPAFGNIKSNEFLASKFLSSRTGSDYNWPLLPFTMNETKPILKIFNKEIVNIFSEQDASEQNFRKLNGARIVHIATHGFVSKDKYGENGLVLANANFESQDSYNDGYVYYSDIVNMDFANTNIVTLSLCDAGLINIKPFTSICDAFIQAGASNVIYSTSKVDDFATSNFMNKFYSYYSVTSNPTDAMKSTLVEMRFLYKAPKDWGSFIVIQNFK